MEDPVLSEAREWLIANPNESMAAASRIFKVKSSTLRSSIARQKKQRVGQGGQNRILTKPQIEALKKWILKQYQEGLGATRQMTFAAICYLRKPNPAPSYSWLTKFIKNELNDFHIIKTKPIALQRVKAQDEGLIEDWFNQYSDFLLTNQIEP
jgi:hypothetical protein